jgi:hypothetical protein
MDMTPQAPLTPPDDTTAYALPDGRGRFFSNVNVSYIDGTEAIFHRSLPDVAADLFTKLNHWPRRVGQRLFIVRRDRRGDRLQFLSDPPEMFSWIQEHLDVRWFLDPCLNTLRSQVCTPVGGDELRHYLCNNAPQYDAIESQPHHTPVPGSFYLRRPMPAPTGEAISALRSHLNAASELDRDLMIAAAVTPGWGGPPGCRPAFLLTSEHGYGVGKSETTRLLTSIWGGCVELNERDDWDKIQKMLMNDEAMGRRCIIIDNIKSPLSHSGLEALITAPEIGGHVLFTGYRKLPNYFTFFLTANTPQLSRDLTDRSVAMRLGPPRHDSDWKQWAISFLSTQRDQFISDAIAFLRQPDRCSLPLASLDRWAPWAQGVLAKFTNGAELLAYAQELRKGVDAEQRIANEVADIIRRIIVQHGYPNPEVTRVRITKSELADAILNHRILSPRLSSLQVELRLKTLRNLPPLAGLSEADSQAWYWTGSQYYPQTLPPAPSPAPGLGEPSLPISMPPTCPFPPNPTPPATSAHTNPPL